jgi:hypothetical protein
MQNMNIWISAPPPIIDFPAPLTTVIIDHGAIARIISDLLSKKNTSLLSSHRSKLFLTILLHFYKLKHVETPCKALDWKRFFNILSHFRNYHSKDWLQQLENNNNPRFALEAWA